MADVVVAGSINMDVVASAPRHPQPGETITGTNLRYFPGGKGANQAVASVRAGVTVRMVGVVGDDDFGTEAVRFLDDAGVDTRSVQRRTGPPTGAALIVVTTSGENTIVVVPGANGTLDEYAVGAAQGSRGDVFVTQYETPLSTAVAFFAHGREVGATCVLNPAPATPTSPELLELVDVLVLNETELALLSGQPITADSSDSEIADAVGNLHDSGLSGAAVATLGARGALAITQEGVLRVDGHHVTVVDTTGAGDCFVGSLAAELASRSPIPTALDFANAAAGLCVTRAGAGPSMPTRPEVNTFRSKQRQSTTPK